MVSTADARGGRFTIDDSLAPLIVVRMVGTLTDAQFDAYLASMTEIVRRPGLRALIYDATKGEIAPASQRKKQAEWMKCFENETRQSTVGTAFVLPSAMVRGFLTAILWLQPMACPHTVVPTLDEAMVWSRARLADNRSLRPMACKF